jgi:hypothetical protein
MKNQKLTPSWGRAIVDNIVKRSPAATAIVNGQTTRFIRAFELYWV